MIIKNNANKYFICTSHKLQFIQKYLIKFAHDMYYDYFISNIYLKIKNNFLFLNLINA